MPRTRRGRRYLLGELDGVDVVLEQPKPFGEACFAGTPFMELQAVRMLSLTILKVYIYMYIQYIVYIHVLYNQRIYTFKWRNNLKDSNTQTSHPSYQSRGESCYHLWKPPEDPRLACGFCPEGSGRTSTSDTIHGTGIFP